MCLVANSGSTHRAHDLPQCHSYPPARSLTIFRCCVDACKVWRTSTLWTWMLSSMVGRRRLRAACRRSGEQERPFAVGCPMQTSGPPALGVDRVVAMSKLWGARWTALLGQCFVGVGVLRHKLLHLSHVLKITSSTVHCYCSRKKQPKLQGGFYRCVPSSFVNQFCWATAWLVTTTCWAKALWPCFRHAGPFLVMS